MKLFQLFTTLIWFVGCSATNDLDYRYTQGWLTKDLPAPLNAPQAGTAPFVLVGTLPAGLVFESSDGTISGTPEVEGSFTVTIDDGSDSTTIDLTVCPNDDNTAPTGGINCACVMPADLDKLDTEEFDPVMSDSSKLGFDAAGTPVVMAHLDLSVFELNPSFMLGPSCAPTHISMTYKPLTCDYRWVVEMPYGDTLGDNVCDFTIDYPAADLSVFGGDASINEALCVEGDIKISVEVLSSSEEFMDEHVVLKVSRPISWKLFAPTLVDASNCQLEQTGEIYCTEEDLNPCNGHGDCCGIGACCCDPSQGYAGNECENDVQGPEFQVHPIPDTYENNGTPEDPIYCCYFTGLATDYELATCLAFTVTDQDTPVPDITVGRMVFDHTGAEILALTSPPDDGADCELPGNDCNGASHEGLDNVDVTGVESGTSSLYTYTVALSGKDLSNNNASPLLAQFQLCDQEPPVIQCPADREENDWFKCGLEPIPEVPYGECDEPEDAPCHSDNVGVAIIRRCKDAEGEPCEAEDDDFINEDGVYNICYYVEDYAGLRDECCYTITLDQTPPEIQCPVDKVYYTEDPDTVDVETRSEITVLLPTPSTDGTDVSSTLIYSLSPDMSDPTEVTPGTPFTLTLVEAGVVHYYFQFTATDDFGNTAEPCGWRISLVDNQAPWFTVCQPADTLNLPPADQTMDIDFTGYTAQDDNVGIASIVVSPDDFENKGPGEYTYITRITDYAGLWAECSTTITVQDNTEPEINCGPRTLTTYPTEPGEDYAIHDVSGYSGTDSSGPTTDSFFDITVDPNNPVEIFPVDGKFEVPCCEVRNYLMVAVDMYGNSAECPFDVQVVDLEPPENCCPGSGLRDGVIWVTAMEGMETAWVRLRPHDLWLVDPADNTLPDPLSFTERKLLKEMNPTDNVTPSGDLRIGLVGEDAFVWATAETEIILRLDNVGETYTFTFFTIDEAGNYKECELKLYNHDCTKPEIVECMEDQAPIEIDSLDSDLNALFNFEVVLRDNGPLSETDIFCWHYHPGNDPMVRFWNKGGNNGGGAITTTLEADPNDVYSDDDRQLTLSVVGAMLQGVGDHKIKCHGYDMNGPTFADCCEFTVTVLERCGDDHVHGEEECDGGVGCTSECVCDESSGYYPVPLPDTSTSCALRRCETSIVIEREGYPTDIDFDDSRYCLELHDEEYVPVGPCDDAELGFRLELSMTEHTDEFDVPVDNQYGNAVPPYTEFAPDEYITIEWCPAGSEEDDKLFSLMYEAEGGGWLDAEEHCKSINGAEFVGRAYEAGCYRFLLCGAFPLIQSGTPNNDCGALIVCDEEEWLVEGSNPQTTAAEAGVIFSEMWDALEGADLDVSSVAISPDLDTPIYPGGEQIFTISGSSTDGELTTTCSFVVRVSDLNPPDITCQSGGAVTCNTDPNEAYSTTCQDYGAEAFEWEADGGQTIVEVVPTDPVPSEFPIGVTNIEYCATDELDNTACCSLTVTVTDDEPPVPYCDPEFRTVSVDTGETFAELQLTAVSLGLYGTDNQGPPPICSIVSISGPGYTQSGPDAAPREYDIGIHTILWECEDDAGNTASCEVILKIKDDEPPTCGEPLVCEISVTDYEIDLSAAFLIAECFSGAGDAQTAPEDLTWHFREEGSDVWLSGGLGTRSGPFDFSQTIIIEARISDNAVCPNTVTCVAELTLIDDGNPCIFCDAFNEPDVWCYDDIVALDLESYFADQALVSDNSYTDSHVGTQQLPDDNLAVALSVSPFAPPWMLDTYIITLTVTDAAGNIGICSFDITIRDCRPPECPVETEHLIVLSSSLDPSQVDDETGTATGVTFPDPAVTDNYDDFENILITPESFTLSIGGNSLAWLIEDTSGNENECPFTACLVDDVDPTIWGCEDPPIVIQCGVGQSTATYVYDYTVTDDLNIITEFESIEVVGVLYGSGDPFNIVITNAPLSGIVDGLEPGEYEITFTAHDGQGNRATCTVSVTVVDTAPPEVECEDFVMRADSTCFDASEFLNPPSFSATDNVGVVSLEASVPAGTTCDGVDTSFVVSATCETVLYAEVTAYDARGNSDTCYYTITVLPMFGSDYDAALREMHVTRDETSASGFSADVTFQTELPFPFRLVPKATPYGTVQLHEEVASSDMVCSDVEIVAEDNCDDGDRLDNCGQEWNAIVQFEDCDASETFHQVEFVIECAPGYEDMCSGQDYALTMTLRVEENLCDAAWVGALKLSASLTCTNEFKRGVWEEGGHEGRPVHHAAFANEDMVHAVITIEQDELFSQVTTTEISIYSAKKTYSGDVVASYDLVIAGGAPEVLAHGIPTVVETYPTWAVIIFSNKDEVPATTQADLTLEATVMVEYGPTGSRRRRLLTFAGDVPHNGGEVRLALKNKGRVEQTLDDDANHSSPAAERVQHLQTTLSIMPNAPTTAVGGLSTTVAIALSATTAVLLIVLVVLGVLYFRKRRSKEGKVAKKPKKPVAPASSPEEAIAVAEGKPLTAHGYDSPGSWTASPARSPWASPNASPLGSPEPSPPITGFAFRDSDDAAHADVLVL